MSEPDGHVMVCTRVSVPRGPQDYEYVWCGGTVARLKRGRDGLPLQQHLMTNRAPMVGQFLACGTFRVRCIANTDDYIDVERVKVHE